MNATEYKQLAALRDNPRMCWFDRKKTRVLTWIRAGWVSDHDDGDELIRAFLTWTGEEALKAYEAKRCKK